MASFFELVVRLEEGLNALSAIISGDDKAVVDFNGQEKSSISKSIAEQFTSLKAMVNGKVPFKTLVELNQNLNYDENTLVEVWNDAENNGIYVKIGESGDGLWQKSDYDNYYLLIEKMSRLTDDYSSLLEDLNLVQREVSAEIPKQIKDNGINTSQDLLLSLLGDQNEDVVAAISDESGFSPLLVTALGKVIIPILKSLRASIGDDELESSEYNYLFSLVDELGRPSLAVDNHGKTLLSLAKVFGTLEVGENSEFHSGEFNYDFAIADENNNVVMGLLSGTLYTPGQTINNESTYIDQRNALKSAQIKAKINTGVSKNVYDYNHIVVYGQSLSTGHEGWPALSKNPKYGNLMVGESVRPTGTNSDNFTAFTADEFYPLVSNVQSGSRILTDAEVANLSQGDGSLGETVNFGMVNFAKKLHNREKNILNDTDHVFVTTNSGVSGKTIEQLSKVNNQDTLHRYSRYTDTLDIVNSISSSQGKTCGVTGIVWMQGEWNYNDHGGSWNKIEYKSLLKQLRLDMVEDAILSTSQEDEPAFITYQTGAAYTYDVDEFGESGLHIGMAQWEFSEENENCYMAGPIYPYTDKGGHLDSNGYRWYGNLLGKIYHKIVTLGQDWKPLSPISSEIINREIMIGFHVPEPPLVFDSPYIRNNKTEVLNHGFSVTDSLGTVPIVNIEIVGETIVKITTGRDVAEDCHIWFANKSINNGNGGLRDSDDIKALDKYEYKPNSGMYEQANITSLVDKPYPLHNWCIGFYIPVNWRINNVISD